VSPSCTTPPDSRPAPPVRLAQHRMAQQRVM
jgi:hypothetical protein